MIVITIAVAVVALVAKGSIDRSEDHGRDKAGESLCQIERENNLPLDHC